MLAKLCATALLALSGTAFAAAVHCPPESVPKEAHPVSGDEAWCELAAERSLLHGPYRAWHPNGVLGTEETYVRGRANGPATYRWGSGEKQAQGSFRDGVAEGWWTFWDKTGVKAGRVRYRNGVVVSGELPRWAQDWNAAPIAQRSSPQP